MKCKPLNFSIERGQHMYNRMCLTLTKDGGLKRHSMNDQPSYIVDGSFVAWHKNNYRHRAKGKPHYISFVDEIMEFWYGGRQYFPSSVDEVHKDYQELWLEWQKDYK